MLNGVMKKITKMTKQEFDELVLKHGLTYVRRLLTTKKNVNIYPENGMIVIETLKKLHRKRQLESMFNGIKANKKNEVMKKLQNDINEVLEQNRNWFINLYQKHYSIKSDVFNQAFKNRAVPDVQNKQFKYVIFVIKSTYTEVKPKTLKYYNSIGYKVYKVVARDVASYTNLIQDLFTLRGHYSHPKQEFRDYLLTLNN
jgi:hypothetical protein